MNSLGVPPILQMFGGATLIARLNRCTQVHHLPEPWPPRAETCEVVFFDIFALGVVQAGTSVVLFGSHRQTAFAAERCGIFAQFTHQPR